jgi:hypothetical protein
MIAAPGRPNEAGAPPGEPGDLGLAGGQVTADCRDSAGLNGSGYVHSGGLSIWQGILGLAGNSYLGETEGALLATKSNTQGLELAMVSQDLRAMRLLMTRG